LLQIDDAKQICRTCPVCGPCLRWALESGDAGVWGGTTEDERRKHRQRAMRVKRRSEIQADFLISLRTYSLFSLFPCACPVMVASASLHAQEGWVISMSCS